MTHLAGNNQPSAWTKALHLFYAGLYAFVLPFICWGAQATPGHPHARAHFVFVEPILSEQRAADRAATAAIAHDGTADHGAHTTPQPAESQPRPAGRATPSMLGVTILLLIGGQAMLFPFSLAGPGFCYWVAALAAIPFIALIPTPPPR